MQCYRAPLLALWVDPSPYCSFVLSSFSPTPSVVFLGAKKKFVIPLSEPLDDSPAKIELFKEVDKCGAARGIVTGIEATIFWQCSPGTVEIQHLYQLRHGPRRAINFGFFGLINLIIFTPYLVFHSQVRTEFVIVFIGDPFWNEAS